MLLALLLAAAPAAPIEFIGFSPDARYAAYVDHGVADGSGFPYASLQIVDVARNRPAAPPVKVSLQGGAASDTEEAAVKQAKAGAAPVMKRLKIASWVPGKELKVTGKELENNGGEPLGSVEVKSKRARGVCEEPFLPLLLSLEFNLIDDETRKVSQERVLPPHRCLSECAASRVFSYRKGFLVLARCSSRGFEGPAATFVPLAGVLPQGIDEDLPAQ
jgi:predicted secreted protein